MYSSMVESIFELMRSDELVEPQVKSDEVEHFILDLLVQCPFCSYVDTSQINLGDHIKEEHVEQLVPSELTDNSHHSVELGANRIFLCPYCTYAVGSISGDKDTSYIVTHVSHCKANPTKKTHGLAKVEFKVSTDQDLVDSILAKKQQGDRYHCNLCGNLVFGSPEALLNHYLDAHSTASLNSLPSDIRQVIEDVVTTRRNNERQEPKLSCLDGEPNTGMQSNQQWSQPVNQTQELESSINAQRPISVDNSKVKREADISNHILGALASTPVPVHILVGNAMSVSQRAQARLNCFQPEATRENQIVLRTAVMTILTTLLDVLLPDLLAAWYVKVMTAQRKNRKLYSSSSAGL